MQIKVNNSELREVYHFKYFGSVLKRDGYCTWEIKARIPVAKEAFNRKTSLLIGKLNIELRKKFVVLDLYHCTVWLRDMDTKEVFGEHKNGVLEENREEGQKIVINEILKV